MNTEHSRREYFEELSERWDGFTDGDRVKRTLKSVLSDLPIAPAEHIVDLGCGTGNLTSVLMDILGPAGTVTAIDYCESMIEVARAKIGDERVRWLVADAVWLPLDESSVDRVVCFSAWPHFPDPAAVTRELSRVLGPGGMLHIVHIDSRDRINAIHGGVGGAIGRDLLPPAHELAGLLTDLGFAVYEVIDTGAEYRIGAERVA